MSELLCVDATYQPDQLAVFAKYNIQYPKENEIVEFVKIVKYTGGKVGLVVKPYDGQYIKGFHHGTSVEVEVSFSLHRFRNLDMTELSEKSFKSKKLLV